MDYHYEVIESTILRFPLPWKKLGCNPHIQPIQFDVALAETHKFGAVSEKDGFIEYWEHYLQNTTRPRKTLEYTTALFSNLVTYKTYPPNYYHAKNLRQKDL